jgi:hypothetical protein
MPGAIRRPDHRPRPYPPFAGIFTLLAIAALHQGIYATIPNYLDWELRYMDAGERGSKAPKLGHQGTPGYQ